MSLTRLVAKYSVSGLVNTVIGYAIISACMAIGLSPMLSNILGFAVGFVTSFLQSRYWVFRSRGRVSDDAPRFVLAFLVAFAVNLLVLHLLLGLGINSYLAQFCACCVFTAVGFLLNYAFVFQKRHK
jgi:putative flippase GtrA